MKCLTEYQFPNLNSIFNLSDAHARQSHLNGIEPVIVNLFDFFKHSEKANYHELLINCFNEYMSASGQDNLKNFEFIVTHTASQSMEIITNYLRLNNLNACLIEPTFDNIPDILKRHNVKINSITENEIKNCDIKYNNIDSLFLTLPNNPTGFILTENEFITIVNYCKRKNILLIIDACFRLFDPRAMFNWYKHLSNSEFIIIEDTGKIWPTQDLKTSFIISNKKTIKQLTRISRDFLLNVSPFTLKLVTEVIKHSKNNNFKDFRELLESNREYLRKQIESVNYFNIHNNESSVSVELIKINSKYSSSKLTELLFEEGFGILPGVPFFWNNREKGESYFRIALARDHQYFKTAIEKLLDATNTLYNGK